MFKTIELALDGSESSRAAIPLAAELAQRDGAKVVVVHVVEYLVGKAGGPAHLDEDELQATIRKQAEELSAKGVETEVVVRGTMLGGPAHVIAEVADEVGADLIVTGTRGHSPVKGLVLGSVTERLLHLAHRPVLVTPNGKAAS